MTDIGHFNYIAFLSLRHQSTSLCHRSLKTGVDRGNAKRAVHMVQLKAKSAVIQHTETIPQVFFGGGCKSIPAFSWKMSKKCLCPKDLMWLNSCHFHYFTIRYLQKVSLNEVCWLWKWCWLFRRKFAYLLTSWLFSFHRSSVFVQMPFLPIQTQHRKPLWPQRSNNVALARLWCSAHAV